MPGDLLSLVDSLLLSVAILFLLMAAYQSYIVRRVMASRVYRDRALWNGGLALAIIPYGVLIIMGEIGVFGVEYGSFNAPPSLLIYIVFLALTAVDSLLLYAWLDSTIGVAREFDFFHTDALRWRRYRTVAWPVLILGSVVGGFGSGQLLYAFGGALIGLPIAYAGLVLVRTASKVHDETMKEYLKWLRFMVAAVVAEIITGSIYANLNFPLLFFSYFFFRAAKSLSVRRHLEQGSQNAEAEDGQGPTVSSDPG